MTDFIRLLVHPQLFGLNAFIALASLMVWYVWTYQTPKEVPASAKVLRVGALCCFSLFAMWLMQQQHHVLNGELFPTPDSPLAVSLKGVTRYVSQRQALFYEYGMFPVIVLILCYAAAEWLLQRGSSKA
jgi:hypothetical protein